MGYDKFLAFISEVFEEEIAMTIWVNEQIDPSGLLYSCIACCDEDQAKDCHASFENNLTEVQRSEGWVARIRTVSSWEEVPASALKLD